VNFSLLLGFLYPYRYRISVLTVDLYKIPIGMLFFVLFESFDELQGLFSCQSYAFFFQPFADDPCCEAVDNQSCGKAKNDTGVNLYFHVYDNTFQ